MDTGELLTRWTVRLAVALYVASLALRRWPRWRRLAWTLGCGCYLLHVAFAFEYYHHWSHDEAYASTARQTAEVTGLDWGAGLYVNYAFTLIWLADVAWWWVAPASYASRPRWLEWSIQAFLGFIVFNATVVFASGFSRWLGIAACLLLIGVWWKERHHAASGQ
jgi:hypothetical protein